MKKLSVVFGAVLSFAIIATSANGDDDIVAVYSSVSPGYSRPILPGGGFKIETYAFGEGGNQGMSSDVTIDQLSFDSIARTIAPTLAKQNYVPTSRSDPNQTNLLIMIYWGTTNGTDDTAHSAEYQIAQSLIPLQTAPLPPPPNGTSGTQMASDPSVSGRSSEVAIASAVKSANDSALQQSLTISQMANRQRDRQNWENAAILGYVDEMKRVQGLELTALNSRRQDVIDEVEESRYYVVLMAYDFQLLLHQKQKKLLWETRFSIRERRNDFSKELAAMAESASRYFGQDSNGLRRQSTHDEHVKLGELKIIRVEPDKK